MSQTQDYPVRAIPLDERLVTTYIKMIKPQYAPYLAAIQAVMNRYIVPYAYLALAEANDRPVEDYLERYTNTANSKINEALAIFGVNFQVTPEPISGGLKLDFTARKGGNTAETSHEITGRGPDFGPVYAQSMDIAKVRWASYTRLVTEDHVREILKLAGMGYEVFMTEGSPTARQVMAVLKHQMKLSAVDPQEYINRLRGAVDKYEVGYQHGVGKYSYISKWISDGFVAAVKATFTVYQVL